MPASGKIQPASEPEEPAQEEILPTVDLGKLRVSVRWEMSPRKIFLNQMKDYSGLTPRLQGRGDVWT